MPNAKLESIFHVHVLFATLITLKVGSKVGVCSWVPRTVTLLYHVSVETSADPQH